jgi:uncharacterized phage-associated protein
MKEVILMARAEDAARFFIDCGAADNDPVTNLRLNKLLYFAQGIHLVNTGAPLFPEEIEAWPLGPVVPDIYHKYKPHKESPIVAAPLSSHRERFTDAEYSSLLDTLREFGIYSTPHLVDLTHIHGGPWDESMRSASRTIAVDAIKTDPVITAGHTPFAISWEGAEFPVRYENDVSVFRADPDDAPDEWPEYNEA